jgi:hypothetical protein
MIDESERAFCGQLRVLLDAVSVRTDVAPNDYRPHLLRLFRVGQAHALQRHHATDYQWIRLVCTCIDAHQIGDDVRKGVRA